MLKVGHAALQRTQALARLGQAHLGIGELTGGLGIDTANAIELIVGSAIWRPRSLACARASSRERVSSSRAGAQRERLGGLLAALGDAHALDLGIVDALLQAADLGEQRAALALKTGDLTGGIALGGTCLLDGGVGLNDLVRSMLKDGSQIGSRPSSSRMRRLRSKAPEASPASSPTRTRPPQLTRAPSGVT